MANTSHGLPYPLGTDRVMDGDNVIRALAEALDPAPVDLVAAGLTPAAGWTIQSAKGVLVAQLAHVFILCTRTGADIVIPASGNLSPDVPMATGLPTAFRPITSQRGTLGRPLVQTCFGQVGPAGDISVTDGFGTTLAGAGQAWVAQFTYMTSI